MAVKQMTKSQLSAHLAERFNISKKQANEFLDEFAKVVIAQTRKTGVFTMPGIGKLVRSNRKARMGRNPATGEAIRSQPRPSSSSALPRRAARTSYPRRSNSGTVPQAGQPAVVHAKGLRRGCRLPALDSPRQIGDQLSRRRLNSPNTASRSVPPMSMESRWSASETISLW